MKGEDDLEMMYQIQFMDGLNEKENEVLNVLPFWQSNSFLTFQKYCEEVKEELSENLLHLTPLPKTFVQKWKEYVLACKKKEPYLPSQDTTNPNCITTLSMPVPGPTTAAGATSPVLDEGLAGLLNYQIPLSQIGTVSSSICVQRDDSFTTYLADLEATPIFMELNLFQTKNYVACQDGRNRWRLATKRVKVPLTAVEEMAIASLLDKVANRIKNSSSLQLKQGTRTSSQ